MWYSIVERSLLQCARGTFRSRFTVGFVFQVPESRRFHISGSQLSEKKYRTERERAAVGNKIKKKARGVITVRPRMRISELAEALNRPVDDVFEALISVKDYDTSRYDEEKKRIEEMEIIKQVVELCGHRHRVLGGASGKATSKSAAKEDDEEDLDEYPTMSEVESSESATVFTRPPVVTMMGHVDHGKTSLLDAFRNSNLCAAEFGGITQHIGAFRVKFSDFLQYSTSASNGETSVDDEISQRVAENGWDTITFLDTPGHAAFSAMRARGARSTDIVVLVVAADDGVQPQTLEALAHARAANVALVVALNKVDKPDAQPARTKMQLAKAGCALEEYGGDIQCVEVSALRRQGLARLAEAILAQAALLNLRADVACRAEGYILEARCDARQGRVVTALVRKGTLQRDSVLVCGGVWCRVRRLTDERGAEVRAARPGDAVQLAAGWHLDTLPAVGDTFLQVASVDRAQQVVAWRARRVKEERALADASVIERVRQEQTRKYRDARLRTLAALVDKADCKLVQAEDSLADEAQVPAQTLHLLLKADVQGSLEALQHVLATYVHAPASRTVRLVTVNAGVGELNETDVTLARQFAATVFCFQTGLPENSRRLADLVKAQGIRVRRFEIVYDLVEAVRLELEAKLPPRDVQVSHGEANVLQVFYVSVDDPSAVSASSGGNAAVAAGKRRRKAAVAGSKCSKGTLQRKKLFRVVRDGRVLLDGLHCVSLRHFKEEAAQIAIQQECGIRLDTPEDFEFAPGDVIQCYEVVKEPAKLSWSHGC